MPLLGKTVFVVEGQYLIAEDLRATIEHARGAVLGPAATRRTALALARSEEMDAAVLGVHLNHGSCVEVALVLKERGVPFIVTSGYERHALPSELRLAPYLAKPARRDELVTAIATLSSGNGIAGLMQTSRSTRRGNG
jgi:ActR/RegA family two-component response regulator